VVFVVIAVIAVGGVLLFGGMMFVACLLTNGHARPM
jgi:hypothetical protein